MSFCFNRFLIHLSRFLCGEWKESPRATCLIGAMDALPFMVWMGLGSLLFYLACFLVRRSLRRHFSAEMDSWCCSLTTKKPVLAIFALPPLFPPNARSRNPSTFLCNWKDKLSVEPLERRASTHWAKAFSRISNASHLHPGTLETGQERRAPAKEWSLGILKGSDAFVAD